MADPVVVEAVNQAVQVATEVVKHGGEHIKLATLSGFETKALWTVWASSLVAIGYGFYMMFQILGMPKGTQKMIEINEEIKKGAKAYLSRQFGTIVWLVAGLAVLLFFTTKVDPSLGLTSAQASMVQWGRALAFVAGALASALTGLGGMLLAVEGNVRVAAAAVDKGKKVALTAAFRTGTVAGMFTIGLGLLGATSIFLIFQSIPSAISDVLVGFGFGGCLLALFMRVGGGIYTKAADVGADLVGKVEKNIPEDDPRNAATIADNVGDNVGDCAGMAADIFESYEVTLVAAMILGASVFGNLGVIFPLFVRAIGVFASIIGTYWVRAKNDEEHSMKPIQRGFMVASILSVVGFAITTITYLIPAIGEYMALNPAKFAGASANAATVLGWKLFIITTVGILLSFLISQLTEYFTSTETKPVQEIAKATLTGPATVILTGTAEGMESSVWSIISIAAALATSILVFAISPVGDPATVVAQTLYGISLVGLGMLTVTGIIVSEDTFGPVSDNAQGIGEMAKLPEKGRKVLDELDAVGNSTKAITKGFAIATAVIAAVSLFASFKEVTGMEFVDITNPKVFVGLLIGGSIPFLFSSLLIRAVSRAAFLVVNEVRRQFKEIKGLMSGKEKPESAKVVDICTTAALHELVSPALLAVLMPVAIGFLLKAEGLAGYLAGVILVGQLMAVYLSNTGGAWDNAKKTIEQMGLKGTDRHKAAVIGDTVGDPFKDTAGPALNPLIKVMNLVALLIAPIIVSYEGYSPTVIIVIVICLGAVIWGLMYSKRVDSTTEAIAAEVAGATGGNKKAKK
ncbi:MAG: sodium-translocating pyrophosphatase [Spirochaetia bacterium]|nr:sodium-translocating pyrophosphatase [Spirochaetia bacterium]